MHFIYDALNKKHRYSKSYHHIFIEVLDIYVKTNLFSHLTVGAKNTLSCCKKAHLGVVCWKHLGVTRGHEEIGLTWVDKPQFGTLGVNFTNMRFV